MTIYLDNNATTKVDEAVDGGQRHRLRVAALLHATGRNRERGQVIAALEGAVGFVRLAAGAEFIVAPGLDIETIRATHALDKPCMPGALTPTEVITAWKAGADMVKIFPCSALGGASYLRALKAPLPQVKMLPTGGVDVSTAADFIKAGAVALGVGAAVVDLKLLAQNGPNAVTERCRQLVEVVRAARAG